MPRANAAPRRARLNCTTRRPKSSASSSRSGSACASRPLRHRRLDTACQAKEQIAGLHPEKSHPNARAGPSPVAEAGGVPLHRPRTRRRPLPGTSVLAHGLVLSRLTERDVLVVAPRLIGFFGFLVGAVRDDLPQRVPDAVSSSTPRLRSSSMARCNRSCWRRFCLNSSSHAFL